MEGAGGLNALNIYVLVLTALFRKKLAISKKEFIQQLAEVDNESMAGDGQEDKRSV